MISETQDSEGQTQQEKTLEETDDVTIAAEMFLDSFEVEDTEASVGMYQDGDSIDENTQEPMSQPSSPDKDTPRTHNPQVVEDKQGSEISNKMRATEQWTYDPDNYSKQAGQHNPPTEETDQEDANQHEHSGLRSPPRSCLLYTSPSPRD